MRVARRRLVRAWRGCIAFITCSKEVEEEVLTDEDIRKLVADVVKWKRSTGKISALRTMLEKLLEATEEDMETKWGSFFARHERDFVKEHLFTIQDLKIN